MVATQKASATLGGKPLLLTEDITWPLRAGVEPVVREFVMIPRDAIQLKNLTRPVELVIKPPEGAEVRVQHLWVLEVAPGDDPWHSRVRVADRRWFWTYGHAVGRFNMRRAVGTKRLLANDLELDVDLERAPELAYWRWSRQDNGNKHTAFTMLRNIMSRVAQIERDYWGQTFEAILDSRLGEKISALPIEELQIDDSNHEAVRRAISYLPEAAVTVDYDGKVIIFSRAAGDEINLVKALVPEILGKGHTDFVDNAQIRPREVHVLFTREVEIRFDFLEAVASKGVTTQDRDPLGELRRMANVIEVPDYELNITRGTATRRYPQGCYVDIDDAMRAWGDLPLVGISRPLDHDLLQRAFIPQMDLWGALGLIGILPQSNNTLEPWVARIAECQASYRQMFQINSRWMDRILSLRAYRLSTINIQTGQRGPALAYGDFALMPSRRARYRDASQGVLLSYAINKSGYPANENETLDSTSLTVPGIVSIRDHDQGIIRINYAMDNNRTYEMVLPSQIAQDSMPVNNVRQRSRPITFNEVIAGRNPPRLSPSYKLAVILTAVPGSPNTNQQLHRIVVKPTDVSDIVPDNVKPGLQKALGPVMEYRVGAAVEVARTRWKDSDATTIEQIFGITDVGDSPREQAAFAQKVQRLTLNEGSTGGKAGASLNQIARARAASIYTSLVDRYEGSMTGYMNGNVHLAGWVNEIQHTLTPKGETYTKVIFRQDLPQMSLFSFLSANERSVVLKLVQPQ
jgi:hypothetical protein